MGKDRNNPIPFREPGNTDDGFTLWVTDVIEDATQIVLEENEYNDPPPDGHIFMMVKIKAKNTSAEPQSFDPGFWVRAVGQTNVEYDSFGCGVIPDRFDSSRNLFQDGEISGNICFVVKSADIETLVMYYTGGPWGTTENWLFLAIQ